MLYHAPTDRFVISPDSLRRAALVLKYAIRCIREQARLPLGPHKTDIVMGSPQFAEQSILDAARELGIDLGATRHGELDVSKGA